jgi:iduronate 2-sulfatase
MSFPQYFKHHNYTVLGHSKLYHPGHPQNYDEPLSFSQDNPPGDFPGDVPQKHQPGSYFYPGDGRDEDHPLGNPAYPLPHQPSGCGYFDVCPSNLSRAHFMDYTTATKAIDTMGILAAAKKPFFMGVGIIRPHLPFVVPLDMWAKYESTAIKQPGSALPPVGYVNISLNDQIFSGNKTFCPSGPDPNTSCFSRERKRQGNADRISHAHH